MRPPQAKECQGLPVTQKLRRCGTHHFLEPPETAHPFLTVTADLQSPTLQETEFLLFQSHLVCSTLLGQPKENNIPYYTFLFLR
jgi:hypothetical protein